MWFKRKKYIEVEIPDGYTVAKPLKSPNKLYNFGYNAGKKESTNVVINGLDKDCQNTEFDTAVILITKDTLSRAHAQEFLKLCYKTNYLYIKVNRGTQNHLILK